MRRESLRDTDICERNRGKKKSQSGMRGCWSEVRLNPESGWCGGTYFGLRGRLSAGGVVEKYEDCFAVYRVMHYCCSMHLQVSM